MGDNLNIYVNGRRPRFIFVNGRRPLFTFVTGIFLFIEEDINFQKIEDDVNSLVDGKGPKMSIAGK